LSFFSIRVIHALCAKGHLQAGKRLRSVVYWQWHWQWRPGQTGHASPTQRASKSMALLQYACTLRHQTQ